jgi:hypothetical protein
LILVELLVDWRRLIERNFDLAGDKRNSSNWYLPGPTPQPIRTLGLFQESKGIDVRVRHVISPVFNQSSIFYHALSGHRLQFNASQQILQSQCRCVAVLFKQGVSRGFLVDRNYFNFTTIVFKKDLGLVLHI